MNGLTARIAPITAAIALAVAAAMPLAHASGELVALPDFSNLVEQDGPAVVNIEAIHEGHKHKQPQTADDDQLPDIFKHFFGEQGMPVPMPNEDEGTAIGSGFLISSDGKILTNHHVVDGADRVIVHLADRREFTAKVIGSDPTSDIALLKVQATGLPYLKMAEAKTLKPGQWVVAIGSPFGLDHSVTAGIVSGIGRSSLDRDQQYVPFIQTDVPINKGNSGGPLLNTRGEVVGINSQIFSSSGGYMGVSFAIPIETAMNAVQQLEATGKVRRGVLGVRIQEVTSQIASAMGLSRSGGALVAEVEPGSAAAKAGVRTGDLITSFNGTEIDSSADLPPLVGSLSPGSHANLRVSRNGKALEIPIVLDNLADSPAAAKLFPAADRERATVGGAEKLGLAVQDIDPARRKTMKLDTDEGVLVTRVVDDVARRAGVQPGDVILRVGNREIGSASAFAAATAQVKAGDTVMLLVRRDDQTQFIALGPVEKG
ncbi:MAG TPA: Do family serine endopeptidase [Xanthomonadaceae bacterium]|jgi:serine protease Do|nr:Do family serine endopeptidase [Xanthomonadaceae bacterium]